MFKKLLCLSGILLLCACSKNTVTQNNLDKIRTNMTLTEVTKILGKPSDQLTFTIVGKQNTAVVWKNPKGTILVSFADDKVTAKEFRTNR